LAHYWKLAREVELRLSVDVSDPELANLADELDLLRDYSEWPTLRERCARTLVMLANTRAIPAAVAL